MHTRAVIPLRERPPAARRPVPPRPAARGQLIHLRIQSRPLPPRWVLLYALVPLQLGLFWLASAVPAWTRLLQCVAILVVFGLAYLWLRLHRRALIGASPPQANGSSVDG